MKTLARIATIGSILLAGAAAWAQSNTTSTTVGNTTYTNGLVNGQTVSTTSQTVGNTTYTSGVVGGQPYSSTNTMVGTPAPVMPGALAPLPTLGSP